MNEQKNYLANRDRTLLKELVLVDGQPGCGKTLFSAIIASIPKVELLQYSPLLENICALFHLNKITKDAAIAMLKIEFDLVLYETMMSRNINFRPRDLSSAFRDVKFQTYIKRLFQKGDEKVPQKILDEKPILHFATHNLLGFSEILLENVISKLSFIEIVRHPLYMIVQQTLNHENWENENNQARQFHLQINKDGKNVPYFINDWEIDYNELKPVEKAIYEMKYMTDKVRLIKKNNSKKNIVTIPFEGFVLNPRPYMEEINKMLNTITNKATEKVMKKQRVPRKRISDGIPLDIYKRCGWTPPDKSLTEIEELDKRRKFASIAGAKNKSLDLLEEMCQDYEKNCFSFKGI